MALPDLAVFSSSTGLTTQLRLPASSDIDRKRAYTSRCVVSYRDIKAATPPKSSKVFSVNNPSIIKTLAAWCQESGRVFPPRVAPCCKRYNRRLKPSVPSQSDGFGILNGCLVSISGEGE